MEELNIKLADLIFPEITETIEDLEKRYPKRNLSEDALVTRFAPSPTGFLHTGSLFTSLIGFKMANQSNGVFYTRLEDTDQKREIEGSGASLLKELEVFGIIPNEGYLGDKEEGLYGPYTQSKREMIYRTVIKEMIKRDLAYPCFCSSEDLNVLREEQEKLKVIPGYYGEYATCRKLTTDEAITKIKNGEAYNKFLEFVSSQGGDINSLEVSQNIQEIKSLKSGEVNSINALNIGKLSCSLGAGRINKEDEIDHSVGIVLNKLVGDKVNVGDTLFTLYKKDNKDIELNIEDYYEIN
jgi:glutamyl-tRNA synthetase